MNEEKFCPTCGRANPLTVRFCGNCGQMFPAGSVLLQKPADRLSEDDTVRGDWRKSSLFDLDVEAGNRSQGAQEGVRRERPGRKRRKARKFRRMAAGYTAKADTSDPTLCAVLSFFLPGVGQMLCYQVVKGIVLILAAYIAVVYLRFSPFGLPMLAARILLAIDAYRLAERRRAGRKLEDWEWGLQSRHGPR